MTWDDKSRKDQTGKIISARYKAEIPHWGVASVHPHIHYPGEMFLDCPGLGIKMHPLGKVSALDALNPAEKVLMKTLEQHGSGVWKPWLPSAPRRIRTKGRRAVPSFSASPLQKATHFYTNPYTQQITGGDRSFIFILTT